MLSNGYILAYLFFFSNWWIFRMFVTYYNWEIHFPALCQECVSVREGVGLFTVGKNQGSWEIPECSSDWSWGSVVPEEWNGEGEFQTRRTGRHREPPGSRRNAHLAQRDLQRGTETIMGRTGLSEIQPSPVGIKLCWGWRSPSWARTCVITQPPCGVAFWYFPWGN